MHLKCKVGLLKRVNSKAGKRQRDWEIGLLSHEYHNIQCQRAREGVKWVAIRRMVKKKNIDLLCIQETKKEQVDKTMCQALWGDLEVS